VAVRGGQSVKCAQMLCESWGLGGNTLQWHGPWHDPWVKLYTERGREVHESVQHGVRGRPLRCAAAKEAARGQISNPPFNPCSPPGTCAAAHMISRRDTCELRGLLLA